MARIVINCWGSFGDVNPYLGLGAELARRGHEPVLAAPGFYAEVATRQDLGFRAVGPGIDPGELRSIELPGPMVAPGAVGGRVTGIDGFGNVQLNVTLEHLASAGIGERLAVGSARLPLVGIFAELPEHALGAIVDSQGFLALVVNKGSAAEALRLIEGAAVVIEFGDDIPPPSRGHLHRV